MGFFSKIFKGVKKVFKKIGKGIKKVVAKAGKFMDKIGIVGQIAMSFILPGVGGALLKGLGNTLGRVAAWAGTAGGNALIQGAKAVIGTATKFVTQTARAFNTVTSGVKNFLGETIKTAVNKIPGISVEGAADSFFIGKDGFFGADTAFGRAAGATAETWNTTIGSSKWMEQFDPLAGAKETQRQITNIVSESTGLQPKPQQVGDFDLNIESPLPEDFKFGSKLPEGYTPATVGQPKLAPSLLEAAPPATPVIDGSAVDYSTMYEPKVPATPVDGSTIDYSTMYERKVSAVTDNGFNFYEAGAGTGVKKAGINLTGEALTGAGLEIAKEYLSPSVDTGYGGQVAYGGPSAMLSTYQVEEAAPLPQFGFPMFQFDIAQPGDAYYRPMSSWKRAMGVA